ncbi:MAG: NAD(P)/FAD-dependent oxidoreductase [Chthoniobacteraceae bacterium]
MHSSFDVVIIGGAFSGAATALLLKRRSPALRVLIIEKSEAFDRNVGGSTAEVSTCFLTRVLGLANYLGHHQLAKQGLRMWFARSEDEPFDQCAEIGERFNSRMPGFHVDRATLDEHLLSLAVAAGCELLRPAKVVKVELGGSGSNLLEVIDGGEKRQVLARWVVDASGRAAVIARKRDYLEPMKEHPVNSLRARFTGVKDWDGNGLREKFPKWANAPVAARGWATNHLCGPGWWCWIIPLKGGDVSVGLVYDERLFTPPEGGTVGERILAHCRQHPVGREILADAKAVEGDDYDDPQLSYRVTQVMCDGWACVGDAAGFLDPLYSPGLDFCAFTAQSVASHVADACEGKAIDVRAYNRRFAFCFQSWFDCIYRDKYHYIGDAELMAAALLMDVATYHLGPVRRVYSDPATMFGKFPFDGMAGRIAAKLIAFHNRRLVALARKRIAAGTYGARNAGWRLLIPGFAHEWRQGGRLLLSGFRRWLWMEFRALWQRKRGAQTPQTEATYSPAKPGPEPTGKG